MTMNSETVEIVFFRLVEGASDQAFLATAATVDHWLRRTDGFQRRVLHGDTDGNWVDVVYWDSKEKALAAAEAIMQTPEGQAFGGMINPDTIFMYHMSAVHTA
jgi:heme-degrading monooxygenase HmoA